MKSPELSIVMPCLNEVETLSICIKKAQNFLTEQQIEGEIIIADNGSTDGSVELAQSQGVRVIQIKEKGYGNALKGGIAAAKGKYILMGDSDDSYDFYNLSPFIDRLKAGYDLVMGNRFSGGIEKGAMPFLHRYLGNPVLSFLGRLFYNINVRDFHCGLRAFRKDAYQKMRLSSPGMEFASEMVVKASLMDLKITEVPTTLSPDGRSRSPHLNTWRDGWRHLRFLLGFSPKWIYLYPGIGMMLLGGVLSILLVMSRLQVGGINFDVQTLLYTCLLVLIGFQFFAFYFLAIVYANAKGLLPPKDQIVRILHYFNLEKGLLIGIMLIGVGVLLFLWAFNVWRGVDFGALNPLESLRITIPSVTFLVLGIQMMIYSFFWHILKLR